MGILFEDPQSINKLLSLNLNIPKYQRPYKWDIKNVEELLLDISDAISNSKRYDKFKYRIGTIIIHKNAKNEYDIVDGQQRIISLLLIRLCLEPSFECSILKKNFMNKITQFNIHKNYMFIREWLLSKKDEIQEFINAFEVTLEVVILIVENESEAFQLFDSQNNRGKALDPHDLLKAYHLREMKDYPYEMQHAVTKWEAKDTKDIRELFELYLFPIWNWSRGIKSRPFTAKEIDIYKGIAEKSTYSYAKRVRRAMPYFQITEPFTSGNDFFEMVEHYLYLLNDIKSEIYTNSKFDKIKKILCEGKDVKTSEKLDSIRHGNVGFSYAKNLFYCALLFYYDKFHNFDEMAVKKLFIWAFMLRVDMQSLGFDSVNKYAIGEFNPKYTNNIGIFSVISFARMHYEISGLQLKVPKDVANEKWRCLYDKLKEINGYGGL